jgi:hypothetical protein
MPPEAEGTALEAKEIAVLRAWIDSGAKAPDEPIPDDPRNHWAFRPPARVDVPSVADSGRNPIDDFLTAERVNHRLIRNAPADRATLLRRVYLDLVGLPPKREELHAFLADASPDAYEKVVERLLASPQYGERWGRHWMDVWRYSDPFGFQNEYRYSQRHIWRWRDWIVESLNADKGYDRMIMDMLAGDELAPSDWNRLRATGYLARNWYKYNRNAWIQDAVEYTAAGFLGITLRCCRCHDHKYDPMSQQDYYRFRAFFEPHNVRIDPLPGQPDTLRDGVARAFDAKPDEPTYLFVRGDDRSPDKARALTPAVPPVLGGEIVVQPVTFRVHDFAAAFAAYVAAARKQAQADLAAAKTNATTAPGALAEKRLRVARVARQAVEARIAADEAKFAERPDSEGQKALALAAGKAERLLAVRRAEEALALAEQMVQKTRADAEKKWTAAKQALADAQTNAAKESAAYAPLMNFTPASSTGRRLALARWMTSRDNPLTARVAVNHVWMRHFGKPLVPTVANFGLAGKKPTHPALLDWLAVRFMDDGWSLKKLHRLIVTSAAYRLSSHVATESPNLAHDPDNSYLWRMNPRRMEAEVVRDSLLAVAGQLDLTLGGPPLDEKLGQTSPRRSLYFRFNTEYRMQFLEQFDAASPSECYERRESIVPQQALSLSNSPLALAQARLLAQRLSTSADGRTADGFITAAFEQVLGRAPTGEERARCERFLCEQTALLQEPAKLTAFPLGPESVVPPAADAAQRARENLVHVLFNHNDFVTIR